MEKQIENGSTSFPVLIITGPVGVGKTTVAMAISDILDERGVSHGLIDLDWLRWCHPSPESDPFHVQLGLKNLAIIAQHYREAGADRLILVDVVETRQQVKGYHEVIPGAHIQVVRLLASLETIHQRLEGRETGASLEWYRHRALELIEQLDREQVGDLQMDTEGRTPRKIAREVLEIANWLEVDE